MLGLMFRIASRCVRTLQLERYKRAGLKLGANTRITGPVVFGSEPYLITIGAHCTIAHGCIFLTHDGATWVFREQPAYRRVIAYGRITVYDNCFIGAGSIILPGVTIGPDSVVGAGSVVTRDVPPNTIVAGNPARVLKTLTDYANDCLARTPEYSESEYFSHKRRVVERLYPPVAVSDGGNT